MGQQVATFRVAQIAEWSGGRLVQGDPETVITGAAFDSRKLTPGALFVAMLAERDGHDFIPGAVEAGAGALLLSRADLVVPAEIPVILVDDTLQAFGDLSARWLGEHSCQVAGITGSNGKTTCKEMLGRIMEQEGPTLRTEGNFNNLIGLPMTLMELSAQHRYAILEMGMNAFGEIARLAAIAAPQVGVITCVAAAHLEGLGSIEGVAKAKGELFAALSADGTAVINADDPHVLGLHKGLRCRSLFFTSHPYQQAALPSGAQVVSLESSESLGVDGFRMEVRRPLPAAPGAALSGGKSEVFSLVLPLVGRHQVSNALAAIAAATALGASQASIIKGLAAMQPTGRRMRVVNTSAGVHLLDDCYNSNPNSARAALQTLQELGAETTRIAVLGDMLELGAGAAEAHAGVGHSAVAMGVVRLFAFGQHSQTTAEAAQQAGLSAAQIFHTTDIDALWSALQPHLQPDTWVLIKGSRGMRLERISEKIEALH